MGDLTYIPEVRQFTAIDQLPDYPLYDDILTCDWDKWMLTADWHLPFLHKPLFKKLILDAEKNGIRRIAIGGDFFDLNAFSYFFSFHEVPWTEEKAFAIKVLNILQQFFDEIVFLASNHEVRWMRNQDKKSSTLMDLYELIGFKQPEMVTIKNKLIIGNWFITHPKQARKQPLSLGRELSAIYRNKHIVVTHAHMQALGRDQSGEFWLFDCGIMADPRKMEYKNFNTTAHYAWNPGYAIIEGDAICPVWG